MKDADVAEHSAKQIKKDIADLQKLIGNAIVAYGADVVRTIYLKAKNKYEPIRKRQLRDLDRKLKAIRAKH